VKTRIGIPRALAYFAYFPFWKAFFQALDVELVISPATSKGVLDSGIKEAVTDACVPIKLFHGHVLALKDKVDYIFLPRMVSVNNEDNVTFCPKFLGLPDLIKATTSGLPPIIDEKVDLQKGPLEIYRLCAKIGKGLGKGVWISWRACRQGLVAQDKFEALIKKYQITPLEALAKMDEQHVDIPQEGDYQLAFAVLGFPYTINDRFISVDLVKKLRNLGVRVLTAEMIPKGKLLEQARKIPKNLFWNFSNQVMRAALYFIDEKKIDGIIHVTAFGCGPDAMVDKMIELEAKAKGKIPFMTITIDEHTGEAGIITRLEAFVDMLKLRRGLI